MQRIARRSFTLAIGGLFTSQVVGCAARPLVGPVPPARAPEPPATVAVEPPPPPPAVEAPVVEPPAAPPLAPSETAETPLEGESPLAPVTLELPARPKNAPTGSAFLERLEGMGRGASDDAILAAILSGNVPDFERVFSTVEFQSDGRRVVLFVLCDYLAIGSDRDFLRMPMTAAAAQKIADKTGTTLPTKRIVDLVFKHAKAKLPPSYIDGGPTQGTFDDYAVHHEKLEKRRLAKKIPLGTLVAGDKKDIVLSSRLVDHPDRVAIYGWHRDEDDPIQPLSTRHSRRYADYSHGVRLVSQRVLIDGKEHRMTDVLRSRSLAGLVSDEGPLAITSYPTTLPDVAASSVSSTKPKHRSKKPRHEQAAVKAGEPAPGG